MATRETNRQGSEEPSTPVINLSRNITLRPMRLSDAEDMARHADNRNIWINLRDAFPNPYRVEDAQSFLRMVCDPKAWTNSGPGTGQGADTVWNGPLMPNSFAITIDDRLVGTIGLKLGADVHRRVGELGYWLGEEHWGKGVMSEVLGAFIAYVWRTFDKIVRIESYTYSWNPKSARVLEKNGFKYVGEKKCHVWKDGKLGDSREWGLVREGLEANW